MKVQNLKFTKLAVSIMALFLMLSFAASTCFAQDSDGGKTPLLLQYSAMIRLVILP